VTDEDGRFHFTIDTSREPLSFDNSRDWESSLARLTWGVEATVDDGSRQATSGFAIVHVYNAVETITLDGGSYVQRPGIPFTVRAAVNTIRDEPVAGRALELQLRRWSHSTYDYALVVQRARFTTGADGRAALAFTIEEPGFYQLRAVGTDALGNAISYTSYVYAFSDVFDRWNGRVNDNELRVDADAASYAPGDAARLLIESSFSGPALLTVERGRVRRAQLIRLEAPLTVVELPIEDGDAPNVYVVVNAWLAQETELQEYTSSSLPDGRLLRAHVNLSVPPTTKRLTVAITPDKEIYAPREEATFTVRVTNYRGEPVSAEVALAVVDEAIYALSEELTGPMLDAFYYERPSTVYTYDSLYPTRWLWAGGMGGGGDGGALAGGPRSDFPDTAAWFPLLTTDWNGEATVTITLPDSLTSWRLTAKAATADTQVGEGVANVLTQQDVVVRPILPRALTVGDRAQLSALVHNYSAAAQALTVTLAEPSTASLLEMLTPAAQTVALAPGEVRMVGWGVRAVAPGSADLLVTAAPTADSQAIADAVQLPLTVRPLAVPDVSTQVGQFSGRFATTIDLPADALPQSAVEVQLSRSIAGSLLEGLEYLTGYPYGCVEQTMSKALPNAVVGRALFQLGVSNPTLQAELPAQIGASVQRLYGYQHNDGGWGWWYDDPSHDYQTAWVLFGLAQTAQAGYEVDANVIQRGVDWLNQNLDGMDPRTRAFALYALATAEQPNADAARALAQNLNSLDGDVFSLAGLALALDAVGERDAARALLDELAATAVVRDDGMVYWTGANDDGYYYDKTMASETRSTALALSAFSRIAPGHALESGMVRWLMAQRRTQGWGTTNETAFALLGLTDHLLATSFSAAAPTTVTLLLNGAPLATGELSRSAPSAAFTVPADQLRVGRNALEVTHTGSGQLYYVINGRMLLARAEIEAAGVIDVRRSYLDGATGEPLARIQAGQLVRVQLTVNMPNVGAYMIIEDRLPGGLEALNEGLNNTSHVATAYEDRYQWRELGYNYKEIFGDRVSFFITEVGRGRRTLTYYARATHSGEFTALPAEVYGMYNLALWGRSASSQVVIGE
jgi:alpha-2-macroglobulin